jgi:nitroreductase
MDLLEAIESNGTCRYFRPDPIPRESLRRAISAARFAPSGGNRQPVSFVVVTDAGLRRELAALYLPRWQAYIGAILRAVPEDKLPSMVRGADAMAHHLAEIPALVVVCARLADCYATDTALGRLSVVGGASIYPAVQNFLLGCRAEGLGTALTTLLVADEPKLKSLLAIPDEFATAAVIAVGFPAKPFPKQLKRREVAESCFGDRFGAPF